MHYHHEFEYRTFTQTQKPLHGCTQELFVSRGQMDVSASITLLERIQLENKSYTQKIQGRVNFDFSNFRMNDYLIIRQINYGHHDVCLSDTQRIRYLHVAGSWPEWINFGAEWAQWVFNPEVQISARAHILKRHPEYSYNVAVLPSAGHIQKRYQFWMEIACRILPKAKSDWLLDKTLCSGLKEISVSAMPIRIAQSLGGWWYPGKPAPCQPPANLVKIIPTIEVSMIRTFTQLWQTDHLFSVTVVQ